MGGFSWAARNYLDATLTGAEAAPAGPAARAEAGMGGIVEAFIGSMPGADAIFDTGATTTLPGLSAELAGAEALEATAGTLSCRTASSLPHPVSAAAKGGSPSRRGFG